jgi:hypothetical protein
MDSNPGHHGGKPATKRLSSGKATELKTPSLLNVFPAKYLKIIQVPSIPFWKLFY